MAFNVHVFNNVSASCKRALEFFKACVAHCFFQFIFRIIWSAVRACTCILYTEDRNVQSQKNCGLNFRCKRKRPGENEFF